MYLFLKQLMAHQTSVIRVVLSRISQNFFKLFQWGVSSMRLVFACTICLDWSNLSHSLLQPLKAVRATFVSLTAVLQFSSHQRVKINFYFRGLKVPLNTTSRFTCINENQICFVQSGAQLQAIITINIITELGLKFWIDLNNLVYSSHLIKL